MKWTVVECKQNARSRSPCGERGLKFQAPAESRHAFPSLPVRGAWVEMDGCGVQTKREKVSLPVRGAWVEIVQVAICCLCRLSRSPCGERGLK